MGHAPGKLVSVTVDPDGTFSVFISPADSPRPECREAVPNWIGCNTGDMEAETKTVAKFRESCRRGWISDFETSRHVLAALDRADAVIAMYRKDIDELVNRGLKQDGRVADLEAELNQERIVVGACVKIGGKVAETWTAPQATQADRERWALEYAKHHGGDAFALLLGYPLSG